MPGLSQLKQFNSDVIGIGDEVSLRKKRGERPVPVELPDGIPDVDDSDDFAMGMPEAADGEFSEREPPDSGNGFSSGGPAETDFAGIDIPDLSMFGEIAVDGSGEMPDLSMFSDEEEADGAEHGTDKLSDGAELGKNVPPAVAQDESDPGMAQLLSTSDGDLFDLPELEDIAADSPPDSGAELDDSMDWLDDIAAAVDGASESLEEEPSPDKPDAEAAEEISKAAPEQEIPPESKAPTEPEDSAAEAAPSEEGGQHGDATELLEELDSDGIVPDDDLFSGQAFSADDFPELSEIPDEGDSPLAEEGGGAQSDASDDFSIDDLGIDGLSFEDAAGEDMFAPLDAYGAADKSSEGTPAEQDAASAAEASESPADLPDLSDLGDIEEFVPSETPSASENFGQSFGGAADNPAKDSDGGEFKLPEADSAMGDEFFTLPEDFTASDEFKLPEEEFKLPDEDSSGGDEFKLPEEDSAVGGGLSDLFSDLEPPGDAADSAVGIAAAPEADGGAETEGIDFNIPITDEQISSSEKTDFELGEADDFKLDNLDFEIPGFSDVHSADGKGKKAGAAASSGGNQTGESLPPNTLSDEQFDVFLQNLSEYPLNVRLAVEEMMIKDEFTDDAEFEIVCKVLKKIPARQLASELERLLDVAIPVPRNFERRTAAEYEAYKNSFDYQLRNKIIPGALLCAAAVGASFLLFLFAKNCIYKPMRAASLYRQGYELLENSDYPQSELKFEEAVKYQRQKGWFFKYARGYRSHKQYTRAERMYRNILTYFNFDKTAGLEYAEMELNELANYEAAEQILLRDVLDHHINDADGILLLGDTYLEWAMEKDPEKLENARLKYTELVALYGQTDLNMSRMMRYFIRTDNLLEVLQLKERFFAKPKSLGAQDWTELSGYLLDKLYGPLPPADEYLRTKIEDVKDMLVLAVTADSANPVALYNLARYHVFMNDGVNAKARLEGTINAFKKTQRMRRRDLYKFIDSYRLMGEQYAADKEFLKAQEWYTDGVELYLREHDGGGFNGNQQVGALYADIGDIDYFISGNFDSALANYAKSIETFNDTPQVRYKVGNIQYGRKNYADALVSFMKAAEGRPNDTHLLLAMGNTLSVRGDNFAAQGYYEQLLDILSAQKAKKGIVYPQVRSDDAEMVDSYMKASNNLGVTLYRLARRTGSSFLNAQAMVQFQESMRAWDSMTRNQETMLRLGGSNLAEQNMKYASHPIPEYEPSIYTDIAQVLESEKGLSQ